MIPKNCKRLAEVDFPVADVSKFAVAEKEARAGHVPKVHVWPAARPTVACRAMLLALLLPDPCSLDCPGDFKLKARQILEVLGLRGVSDYELRQALLRFISAFAQREASCDTTFLKVGVALIRAAHGNETIVVNDPFSGGGAIPLEALRLGCDVYATDLNPVACLILKAVLEDLPRGSEDAAGDLSRVAAQVTEGASVDLAEFYPADSDGAKPIAYIWARTVRCETPGCGAEIPLVRSFWLSSRGKRKRALRPKVSRPAGRPPAVEFEIFDPKSDAEVPAGTVTRAKATCVCCRTTLPVERVRAQLAAQRGGADVAFDEYGRRVGGARLLVVVTSRPAETGRNYRLATEMDYEAVRRAAERLNEVAATSPGGMDPLPDEPLPPVGTLGFRVQRYGMLRWGDVFTSRQKVALLRLGERIGQATRGTPIESLAALCFSKQIDMNNALATWQPHAQIPAHMLTRFAVPMKWDFAEAAPMSGSSGSFEVSARRAIEALPSLACITRPGTVGLADATRSGLPDGSVHVWFTDPPYYDAVPYADLSDFFFVWLKRAFPGHPLLRDPFDSKNTLTPKTAEIVQDETRLVEGRAKDRAFFEERMGKAFAEGRRVLQDDGVSCVVFAHKTTEGWEALLSGLRDGSKLVDSLSIMQPTPSWAIGLSRS